MDIDANQRDEAEKISREISDKLLANPIMEDFSISLEEHKGL
jgi:phosphoribosylformylglycinamidine (FGAM) synthase PurS component